MSIHHDSASSDEPRKEAGGFRQAFVRTPRGVLLSLIVAALGAYLLAYHTSHVLLAVPYLFLLACPLMHVFMHGGHGHGAHGNKDDH
jgi:hypothetical protein